MSDVLGRLRAALADRYRIERELGAGGMATVYLAEDLRHHRQVALKVLKPEVAARLQHPNSLPLLDSGEAAGFFFYVMPYVEGESLRDRLARDLERVVEGELLLAAEPVAQRFALDVGHHVVERARRAARVVKREDVGVGEASRDLDLAQEALGTEDRGEVGVQHLERHGAVVLEVFGEVHRGHPARAELALDGVTVGEGSP